MRAVGVWLPLEMAVCGKGYREKKMGADHLKKKTKKIKGNEKRIKYGSHVGHV